MFKNIVPKKFVIEQSVFLIDSQGNVSNEVDLAIFDEMYTPYIFRYYDLKFIPIEAVAVVVECKSKSMKEEELRRWTESISELKTSPFIDLLLHSTTTATASSGINFKS